MNTQKQRCLCTAACFSKLWVWHIELCIWVAGIISLFLLRATLNSLCLTQVQYYLQSQGTSIKSMRSLVPSYQISWVCVGWLVLLFGKWNDSFNSLFAVVHKIIPQIQYIRFVWEMFSPGEVWDGWSYLPHLLVVVVSEIQVICANNLILTDIAVYRERQMFLSFQYALVL